ncbi:unnamed protein product [Prorocentrum cordatum]|uniref:Uncharacterized protein n=1 Tax=Prorocentrum cordatum TaxID=2364126 RepID=A0ABN9QBL6_9DINO|nr:unnamed protein product [Polarella glacialis]
MPHVLSASARIMRRALAVQNGYCVHLPIRLPLDGLVPPTCLPPPGLDRATADVVLDYLLLRDPPVVKRSLEEEEEEADIKTVSDNISCRMQASESLVDVDIGVQASESLVDVGVQTVDVADFHCEVGCQTDSVKGTSTCSQATIADVKAWIDAVASINELNAIQYLKNGMDLFDKLVTERGFPTKKAQKDYARKLYEMLQNVQATLEDLLGFFEVHRFLTGQMNSAEMAKFLEVSKCSDYRIIFFGRPRSFDKLG